MNPPVHILATVRNPDLLAAALLVFKTLRLGLPRNPVIVYGNGLRPEHAASVQQAAAAADAEFRWVRPTAHDIWLEHLVQNGGAPFWICDTDMVFLAPVRPPDPGTRLAGRLEPGFCEEWSKSWHVERLHTCLLWLDPVGLRAEWRAWMTQHVPGIFGHAETHFLRQHFVPRHGQLPLFYDTAAGAYQAFGGTPFDAEQNAAFEHLHCGTYSDLVSECSTLKDLPAVHAGVFADPARARGLAVAQAGYYERRNADALSK